MQFEKREGETEKGRTAEEVLRLSDELASSRGALKMKSKELSTALTSFAKHQRNAEQRDNELRALSVHNDHKVGLVCAVARRRCSQVLACTGWKAESPMPVCELSRRAARGSLRSELGTAAKSTTAGSWPLQRAARASRP